MKLSKREVLLAVLGLSLNGCWGSDYKIGDVVRDDELTRVDSGPTLAPVSLSLTPCQDRLEIDTFAILEGTLDCAGRPCALPRYVNIESRVTVTSDGSELFVTIGLDDFLYYGRVQRGRVGPLRVLAPPAAYARTSGDLLVIAHKRIPESTDYTSTVYRFGPDVPELLVSVPGLAHRVTGSAAAFALRGHGFRSSPDLSDEFDWLSRHDADGTTLFLRQFPGTTHWNDIALGGQGTLFEYRVEFPNVSSLVRYDLSGDSQQFATVPESYRQAAAVGTDDRFVVATAESTNLGGSPGLGVRAYDASGSELWSYQGLEPIGRQEMRAVVARNGDAYVATGFREPGTTHAVLGVLRFSPTGQVCLAGSWTFEQPFQGPVGLVEVDDGVIVATPHRLGIVPKR